MQSAHLTRHSTENLADDMLEHAAEITRQVMEQREEILQAFVAKFGFNPDECEQIYQGNSFFVVRLAPDRVRRIQREVILSRLSQKKFSWWQEFCLRMAGIRK